MSFIALACDTVTSSCYVTGDVISYALSVIESASDMMTSSYYVISDVISYAISDISYYGV